MRNSFIFALLAGAVLGACTENGTGIPIDGTGAVAGIAFIDRNGDGVLNQTADVGAAGVLTALLLEGTSDTVARATSRADGSFILPRIQPGRYRLVATRGAVLGDTVDVLRVDSAQLTVIANDTVIRHIRLGYPQHTVASMKVQPTGRRITVEGVALNGWITFGDSTIHLRDPTGTIRAVRVTQSNVQAGDSVRFLGTTGVDDGRPVLAGVIAHVLGAAAGLPAPDSLSTAQAATADAGRIADGHVRIAGALIRDTATQGEFRRVGVDDGSGRVEVLLKRTMSFPAEAYSPGAIVQVTGVLAPAPAGGGWQIKPRGPADMTSGFSTVTTAGARTVASGTRVYIHGIALTGSNTFDDRTMHVADAAGAIRAIRVAQVNVAAGDSVRILGTTGLANGKLVLADAGVTVLAPARGLPPIPQVTTGQAATAAGGARADNHVRIVNATIVDSTRVAGDRIIGVNDGSGRLEVVLDQDVSFNPGPFAPGGAFTGAGVLVPNADGSAWRLKPRDREEASVAFPTATIAQARALGAGQQVVLQGIAMNGPTTFGDSTVHLRDHTGTMRALRVTANFAAGDSVRLLGTMDTRGGQPALSVGSVTVVRAGVGVAEPDSLSTVVARTAGSGTRDADFVRVGGEIVGAVPVQGGSLLLTVNDGTGSIEVFVHPPAQQAGVPLVPGALVRVAGLLVPAAGGRWQLKPRNVGDVTARYQRVTVSEARLLTDGRTVEIHALALNNWVTFGDNTVHITDRQRAIRVIDLAIGGSIFAGDSIRIVARKLTRNGQPVLTGIEAAVELSGVGLPAVQKFSTGTAAGAVGGARDADQISATGTVVQMVPQGEDLVLWVNDGSGTLQVVLDADVGFPTGAYQFGQLLDVRGVLVPTAAGTSWQLKPRSLQEVQIR